MNNLLKVRFAWLTTAVLLSACESIAQEPDALTKRSIDYVLAHPDSCTLGDAYVCQPIEEMAVIAGQSTMAPGAYLKVWPLAYDDFRGLEELNAEQKDLKHYKIGFAENEKNYLVIFSALLLPQINAMDAPEGLLRTSLGKSMRYEIDKQSLDIVSRKYYK
jgi:hypothetical protein